MALERCPHCPERVRKGTLDRHLKRCINYRRKVKRSQIVVALEDAVVEDAAVVDAPPIAQPTPEKKKRKKAK